MKVVCELLLCALPVLLNRAIFTVVCHVSDFTSVKAFIEFFLIYASRNNFRIRLYVFISVFFSRLYAVKYLLDLAPLNKMLEPKCTFYQ